MKKTNFKKTLKRIALPLILGFAQPETASAQEQGIKPNIKEEPTRQVQLKAKNDLISKYVFRGIPYSQGKVLNQYLSASSKLPKNLGNLTATAFGNYDFEKKEYNEADIFIDYAKPINDKLTLLAGWGAYYSPTDFFEDTHEAYIGLTANLPLNPTIIAVKDLDESKGKYIEPSVSHQIRNLNLSAKLGYNDEYFREKSGFSHLESTVSYKINPTENTTIEPFISHSESFDKSFLEDETYGGIRTSINF